MDVRVGLRCEQFGSGIVTDGGNTISSLRMGMDTEYTGPISVGSGG